MIGTPIPVLPSANDLGEKAPPPTPVVSLTTAVHKTINKIIFFHPRTQTLTVDQWLTLRSAHPRHPRPHREIDGLDLRIPLYSLDNMASFADNHGYLAVRNDHGSLHVSTPESRQTCLTKILFAKLL